MRSLLKILSITSLFFLADCAPVDGLSHLRPQSLSATLTPAAAEPTRLSVPKEKLADDLGVEYSDDGWASIFLAPVPPAPEFLFNFSIDARDYSISKKFVTFFKTIRGLVGETGFDDDSFEAQAEKIDSQYSLLKNLVSRASKTVGAVENSENSETLETISPGVIELFNTTVYFYQLMQYHQTLTRKEKANEFSKHDAICVELFITQLDFHISLMRFLGFNGVFVLNSEITDLGQKFEAVRETLHVLGFKLAKVFYEKSQVFEYNMGEYSTLKILVSKLESFVKLNWSETNARTPRDVAEFPSRGTVTINLDKTTRSLDETSGDGTEGSVKLSQTLKTVQEFTSRLDTLCGNVDTMELEELKAEIDTNKEEFKQLELQSVRWSKLAVAEGAELYAILESNLAKLDEIDGIYKDRVQLDGELQAILEGSDRFPTFTNAE